MAAQPVRWSDILRFDAEPRWYRRLHLADDREVWLLTWLPYRPQPRARSKVGDVRSCGGD